MNQNDLAHTDPELYRVIQLENQRQEDQKDDAPHIILLISPWD